MKPYYLNIEETTILNSGDVVAKANLIKSVREHVENDGIYAQDMIEVRTQTHAVAFKIDNAESVADRQSRFYACAVAARHAQTQADDMARIVEDAQDMCLRAEHYLEAVILIYGEQEIDEEWRADFMAHYNGNVGETEDF